MNQNFFREKEVYLPPVTEAMVIFSPSQIICTSNPQASTEEWDEVDLSSVMIPAFMDL